MGINTKDICFLVKNTDTGYINGSTALFIKAFTRMIRETAMGYTKVQTISCLKGNGKMVEEKEKEF